MPPWRGSLQRGDVLPRYHATSRPSYVEAVATARALAFARATDSPVHVVHLSSAAALDEVRRAKAAGVRVTAETCPHYLTLTDAEYEEPDPTRCACYVISPPLRSADRPGRAVGGARRRVTRPGRHRSRPRPGRHREGRGREGHLVRQDQQRRAGHRDAARAGLQRGRRPRAPDDRAHGRRARDHPGRAVRPRAQGGDRGGPRRRSRAVRPEGRRGRSARPSCTTRATTRPTRA